MQPNQEKKSTGCPYGFPHRFGGDGLVFGDLVLPPTSFSIGPIEINGKTFLKLLQLNLLCGLVFKSLQDPENEKSLVQLYNKILFTVLSTKESSFKRSETSISAVFLSTL